MTLPACGPPGGSGERGTTRLCVADDGSDLDKTCYRQCAAAEPECTATRKGDGDAEVFECLKEGDGSYTMDMDGSAVPPAGETECFMVVRDGSLSSACMDVGANLEFQLYRAAGAEIPEGACYDFNCAVSDDAGADCPDLG